MEKSMTHNANITTDELWAVISNDGFVMWTHGGSSTSPRLMVYPTESKANIAIKYFTLDGDAKAVCVYRKSEKVENGE